MLFAQEVFIIYISLVYGVELANPALYILINFL